MAESGSRIPQGGPRIGIIGPGAMGTRCGVSLSRAGLPVTVLVRDEETRRLIGKRGLILRTGQRLVARVKAVCSEEELAPQDLVLILVKSYDTASAIRACRGWVGNDTVVVSLQNGLSHMDPLLDAFGPQRVLLGVTSSGATRLGPGEARWGGNGATWIGWSSSRSDTPPDWVIRTLQAALDRVRPSPKILWDIWRKVVISGAINPVAALLRLRNGQLLVKAEAKTLMRELVVEATQVAQAEAGIEESAQTLFRRVTRVCRETSTNACSMLQDVQRGRRTEINSITGEVVQRGRTRGLSVSHHETLWWLVQGLENIQADGGMS